MSPGGVRAPVPGSAGRAVGPSCGGAERVGGDLILLEIGFLYKIKKITKTGWREKYPVVPMEIFRLLASVN